MRQASLAIAACLIVASPLASAAPITAFAENFENGLSAWIDRNPGNNEAAIVADPLNSSNHVLGFRQLGSGGSIFTRDLVTASGSFTISFDYLGMPGRGGRAGDLGGFFGISQGFPDGHYWVAGTGSYPAPIGLTDDGAWHRYSLTFDSPIGQSVRLMFEDFVGSGGVAGDVYFDNIQFNDSQVQAAALSQVPEPSGIALLAAAMLAAGLARKRKPRA